MDHLHSATIALLFQPVLNCPLADGSIPFMFANCEDYHNNVAQEMRHRSFVVGGYWAAVLASALIGHVLTFYGFGTASERLNKRVRDSSFAALLRQEVAFFDKRSVGRITSQLQDDAAKIHAFLGEPIRSFIIAIASFLTGIIISFLPSCNCETRNSQCRKQYNWEAQMPPNCVVSKWRFHSEVYFQV